eukprot:NODE_344_length_9080_cov_0.340051.p6 type:complete len:103 gc:universal NODE_344_length_9080_cov_0.340051:3153-2845(-)
MIEAVIHFNLVVTRVFYRNILTSSSLTLKSAEISQSSILISTQLGNVLTKFHVPDLIIHWTISMILRLVINVVVLAGVLYATIWTRKLKKKNRANTMNYLSE